MQESTTKHARMQRPAHARAPERVHLSAMASGGGGAAGDAHRAAAARGVVPYALPLTHAESLNLAPTFSLLLERIAEPSSAPSPDEAEPGSSIQ
eukprot:6175632-Pleurochrysis_carterae.AAC.2